MPDLLVELFSEEIPARMQARAADDLKRLMTDGLVAAGLTYAGAVAHATPRRLALHVEGLTAHSPTLREERKGPRTDAPAAAVEGFLRSTGLTRDQLVVREAGKSQVYFAVVERPGRPAAEIVAEVLEATVRGFPWPKSMRWGSGSLRWVRPLRRILCLLSDEAGVSVVPLTIDGIVAGDVTEGHRFLAPQPFRVTGFADYTARLKRAHVLLDAAERAAHIWADATSAAFAQGLEVVEDRVLLAEVAGLVEWPVVLMGDIGAEFLDLPPEVLQTSMREHQKFFSVRHPRTGRIEKFVTVANMETADQGATILKGNGKVLRARLSDARFFWENDLRVAKAGMEDWATGLASVTFHAKLGSQAERIDRIAALAREIAPAVGADPDLAERAARLTKLDLRSAMVGEFPELQGVMGRYYALAAGEDAQVADAARDHYSPLGPTDTVPTAPVSVAVALADKIDTLTGFWAIDEKPTGSKDPFALRRAALGVIRLVLGNGVRVGLNSVIKGQSAEIARQEDTRKLQAALTKESDAVQTVATLTGTEVHLVEDALAELDNAGLEAEMALLELKWLLSAEAKTGLYADMQDYHEKTGLVFEGTFPSGDKTFVADLLTFLHDRLKVFLRDDGIRHDVIDATLAMPGNDDLTLVVARARALAAFLKTDDGENLLQGFRRANNILTQAEAADGVEYSYGADRKFAEHAAETALFDALDAAEAAIAPALASEDFATAMSALAALRAPIDAFFTAVQVNSDNPIVRRNRLKLLSRIRRLCLTTADLTRIEG
jgi:glycyl-tRNA synthetase beta chain